MKIPLQNIYYLLSYALDFIDEKELIAVKSDDFKSMLSLLTRILINGCNNLIKNGLDRNYIAEFDSLPGIRGKIDIAHSLKQNTLISGHLYCSYDEFHHNILHNKIIKSVLLLLLKTEDLDQNLHDEIRHIYSKFAQVDPTRLTNKEFNMVKINRNNKFYYFLIQICRLISDNCAIQGSQGNYVFSSFEEDDQKMGKLFEKFLFNFYAREQNRYSVNSEHISWNFMPTNGSTTDMLPRMETDISLQSKSKKIIIEAKFYKDIFSKKRDTEKLRSNHLYQLYSYLSNISSKGGLNKQCEGLLLYAETNETLAYNFKFGDQKLTIRSINLNQNWQNIHEDLLAILD